MDKIQTGISVGQCHDYITTFYYYNTENKAELINLQAT